MSEDLNNKNQKLEKELEYQRGKYDSLKECYDDSQSRKISFEANVEKIYLNLNNKIEKLNEELRNLKRNTDKHT